MFISVHCTPAFFLKVIIPNWGKTPDDFSYLGGAALATLTDVVKLANNDLTYAQLKAILPNAFPDDRNRDMYWEKLMECKQKRLE